VAVAVAVAVGVVEVERVEAEADGENVNAEAAEVEGEGVGRCGPLFVAALREVRCRRPLPSAASAESLLPTAPGEAAAVCEVCALAAAAGGFSSVVGGSRTVTRFCFLAPSEVASGACEVMFGCAFSLVLALGRAATVEAEAVAEAGRGLEADRLGAADALTAALAFDGAFDRALALLALALAGRDFDRDRDTTLGEATTCVGRR
jgi:hypothetical protein